MEEKLKRVARFPISAQLDGAGGKKKGVVEIDRDTNIVTVRPQFSRTVYNAKLEDLADLVVKRVLMQGFEEVYAPKKAQRRRG